MMFRSAAVLVLAALASAPVLAQPSVPPGQPSAQSADRGAVGYVVQDSVGEVQLARLALSKTQSASVRAFAQRMITDHSAAAQQGFALAKQIGASDV
ncbi:MAG: DUF4142 domain-containing protein, partial [Candidatus Eremiobacteraeota bacterium]|nr:DUF4142 domain-containing protein [Candidatus Eremiobacteraeota bacterium]